MVNGEQVRKPDGGRLEGHTNDIGVQFEIVGEEISQIKSAVALQARDVEQMRQENKQIITALQTLVMNSSSPNVMGQHPTASKRAPSAHKQLSYLHDPLRVEHPPMQARPPSVIGDRSVTHLSSVSGQTHLDHHVALANGGHRQSAEDRTQDGQWQAHKGAPSSPEPKGERKRRHRSRKAGADSGLEA